MTSAAFWQLRGPVSLLASQRMTSWRLLARQQVPLPVLWRFTEDDNNVQHAFSLAIRCRSSSGQQKGDEGPSLFVPKRSRRSTNFTDAGQSIPGQPLDGTQLPSSVQEPLSNERTSWNFEASSTTIQRQGRGRKKNNRVYTAPQEAGDDCEENVETSSAFAVRDHQEHGEHTGWSTRRMKRMATGDLASPRPQGQYWYRKSGGKLDVEDRLAFRLRTREAISDSEPSVQLQEGTKLSLQGTASEGSAEPSAELQHEQEEEKSTQKVQSYALRLLARGMMPKAQLEERLQRRDASSEDIMVVMEALENIKLVDDAKYAEGFAKDRFRFFTWGPARIRFELEKKNIDLQHIEAAIAAAFQGDEDYDSSSWAGIEKERGEDEDEDVDLPGNLQLTPQVWKKLKEDARKQWLRDPRADTQARRRRLVAWLQRRGYSWDIVSVLLRNMKAGDPE